jgi:hypothetical protein
MNLREKQLYDWIYSINPKKIIYKSIDVQKKIIRVVGKWLELNLKINEPILFSDEKICKYVKLLEKFLYKQEFFPYFTTFGCKDEDELELVYQIDKYYFVVSLCESEPKRFKYVIQTTDLSYIKNKFDVLSDSLESNIIIKLNKGISELSSEELIFENYETLKKKVCQTINLKKLNYCTPTLLLSNPQKNMIQKSDLFKRVNCKRFFTDSQNFRAETLDGVVHFSLDLILSWSNTIANLVSDMEENSEVFHIDLPFSKRGFLFYCLYRLKFIEFIEHPQKIIELLGCKFYLNSAEFIELHQELYRISDYLEDQKMIEFIMTHFEENVSDVYTRQIFLELINL